MSVFAYRDTVKGDLATIEVAFTDSSSDLGDRQGVAARDRALISLGKACGAVPWVMAQVHGTKIRKVEGFPTSPVESDGLVTSQVGVAAVVRVADCVPILLADPKIGLIGAAHAGRAGLAAGVVTAVLQEMRTQGGETLLAWVGPHICGACYEVPDQMRDEVAAAVPSTYATSRWGTPALDLGAGVIAQLTDAGCAVTLVDGCTFEDSRWHSFRRDGAASGRMAGLIWTRA